jgi:hypothetical protein
MKADELMCFTLREQEALFQILRACAAPLEKIIADTFDTKEEMGAFRDKIERLIETHKSYSSSGGQSS